MTQLGDRRKHVRLEVVGSLWASLELREIARVLNRSDHGFLVSARTPAAVEAVQPMEVTIDGRDVQTAVRVRHVRRAIGVGGATEYLLGVELSHEGSPVSGDPVSN